MHGLHGERDKDTIGLHNNWFSNMFMFDVNRSSIIDADLAEYGIWSDSFNRY